MDDWIRIVCQKNGGESELYHSPLIEMMQQSHELCVAVEAAIVNGDVTYEGFEFLWVYLDHYKVFFDNCMKIGDYVLVLPKQHCKESFIGRIVDIDNERLACDWEWMPEGADNVWVRQIMWTDDNVCKRTKHVGWYVLFYSIRTHEKMCNDV